MSYEPEIVIGSDKAVLGRICDPFTKVVSYAPTEQEWRVPFKLIDEFRGAKKRRPDLGLDSKHQEYLNAALVRWTEKLYGENIKQIVEPLIVPFDKNDERAHSNVFKPYVYPVGCTYPDEQVPHIDPPILRVFASFNRHMCGTYCIPKEFAHSAIGKYGVLPSADVSKAIKLPGVSLSMIKIGEIAHLAPPGVVETHSRIVLMKDYKLPPFDRGDFFPFKAL